MQNGPMGAGVIWFPVLMDTGTHIMKTTIEIADDLAAKAKEIAARQGTTLRALIESGLRRRLAEEQEPKGYTLPDRSVKGRGLQPALRDRPWSGIRDAAYEGRGA